MTDADSLRQGRAKPKMAKAAAKRKQPEVLEEQLESGLEDSFPASDPPAVVSTTISGGGKKLVGVEEHLRRKREEKSGH